MDLSRYIVLDCRSGTFFNAAHAVLIDVDALPDHDEVIDLETWSPPDSKEAQALDAVAALLNNEQWSSDHLEAVADMVRATGRAIGDNFHADTSSESSLL